MASLPYTISAQVNISVKTGRHEEKGGAGQFPEALDRLIAAWDPKLLFDEHSYLLLFLTMPTDFRPFRDIPILDAARSLSMDLRRVGDTYVMWDAEKGEMSSLIIFPKTNTWCRFSGIARGGVHRGSPIDLVMHVRECSLCESIDYLRSHYPHLR